MGYNITNNDSYRCERSYLGLVAWLLAVYTLHVGYIYKDTQEFASKYLDDKANRWTLTVAFVYAKRYAIYS